MLHTIDVLIIFAFIGQALWSGWRNRKVASQSLEEYFLAGRTLPGWKAGLSMAATQFAADTPLLVTGLIATAGIFALWRLWIYALAFLLMGFLLARSWRRVNVLTDAELTEIRYGEKPALVLRMIKAVYFGTVINCVVMAMVLLAATRIAEPFLVWNQWLPAGFYGFFFDIIQGIGVPITANAVGPDVWINSTNNILSILAIVITTTLYSTSGGLRSVVATDVMQFFIMMLATILYAWFVIDHAGGMGPMLAKIDEIYSNTELGLTTNEVLAFTPSQAANVTYTVFAVLALQWLVQMNSDGTGYLAQRTMACRSEKDAKQAAIVFTFAQVFFRSLFWLPIGLGLVVLFPPDQFAGDFTAVREATFVRGMAELLPAGVKGLLLTGMLAALASTIDTHLNWGASYWSNDIYKRLYCEIISKREANPRTLVWVARVSNVALLFIALAIMFNLQNIQVAWQASLILGAGMGIPLILRWVWWRMNSWGEIAAIFASAVVAPILLFGFPDLHESAKLLINAIASLSACLLAVFFFGPEKKAVLQSFFDRARPYGFWPGFKGGEQGMSNLQRALSATAVCALSIFCLLVGLGSWLVGAPAPAWFGHSGLWIALNILAGLALMPLWYRLGFRQLQSN